MSLEDIVLFPVNVIAKCAIFAFGWSWLDDSIIARVASNDRSVLIFSHTSYVDFFVLIIYLLAYRSHLRKVRTLVKPQPFKYIGFLLRNLGAIPSTRIEDKNGGAVNRITTELRELDKFAFLISPKGTILNAPWKKGYYYIAKELNAKVMVTGFDYEEKRIVMFDEYSCTDYEEDTMCKLLQQDMGKIVPLFPDCEVVEIRQHDKNNRGVINYSWLLGLTGTIFCMYEMFYQK